MGKNKFKKLFYKCKSLLRPSPERPSLLTSSQLTPSRMSKLRSKTRKVSHQTSRDSSSLVSSSRTAELSLTTTSRRSQPSILFSDSEVVCRSSSRLSLVRPSPSMSSQQTLLRTSRPRSRIRKVSHQISRDSSSLESSSRTAEPCRTTTSRRSPPFTWCSDLEVVTE